ncbi:MAG TPA: helix-turn-helix transcriptional regulator [Microbacteriaceae bacterium]|nr:helix-turn-helix transcriptional regulator [Microbacteriaceae bacterium]
MSAITSVTDDTERRIGLAIRQWRIDAGLSQEELADRASLSRSAVQKLEAGRGSRLETLIRALRALDRIDALDALAPRTGPSPIEQLAAQRRAQRTTTRAPRVSRRG